MEELQGGDWFYQIQLDGQLFVNSPIIFAEDNKLSSAFYIEVQ